MNLFSLGQFEKNVKTLGYDTIFHTSVNVVLSDGTEFNIEKHDTIIVGPVRSVAMADSIIAKVREPVPLAEVIHGLEQFY